MKSDSQLQHDVMAELEYEPSVDHADIGVSVNDGVVMLSGFVKSYAEKMAAEKAARRVALSDIVLELAASNIACSYLDQPVEVPGLRLQLARIMGVAGFPQMLLRIGRGTVTSAAVRREPRLVIGT